MKFENTNQKIAAKNIKGAYNWTIGGYENSLADEGVEMPSVETLFGEVMSEGMNAWYIEGRGYSIKQVKLAGKKFCAEYLATLFEKDGYEVPAQLLEKYTTKKPVEEPKTHTGKLGTVLTPVTPEQFKSKYGYEVEVLSSHVKFGSHKRVALKCEDGSVAFHYDHILYQLIQK